MQDVTAAVLIKDGKLLIAKRKSTDKLANKWELPGGKIEKGESPKECLKRELKEEFNIDVMVKDFMGENVYSYDYNQIKLLAFQVELVGGQLSLLAHEEYKWVSLNDL